MDIKHFLDIEKKYDLYSDQIDGICYWNYSRFEIWNVYVLKQKLELGVAHNQQKKNKLDTLNLYWRLLVNSITLTHTNLKESDICIINHPRKVLNNGKYECLYTDKFSQGLVENNLKFITLERPYQLHHMDCSKPDSLQYLDILTVEKMVYNRVFPLAFKTRYHRLVNKIESKIREPLTEIEKVYDVQLDIRAIVKYIAKQVLYYKSNIKTVYNIVEKIKPKVMIQVVSYSFDCMMFTEVCRKNKIPVVELQHGILTNHIAYNYETKKKPDQIPDKIFLFSKYWRQHISWPMSEQNIITTGFPYFEEKIKDAKKIKQYDDGRVNILFISQGTIGKKLSEVAIQLSQKLDANKYRIIYKLHPGEYSVWQKKYNGLDDGKIFVIDDNKTHLYDCFASCHLQVGVYSTALYEGLGFGLKTYIYKIEMSEQMEKLNALGYVDYFADVDELYNYIEQSKVNSYETENIGEFWRKDALNNMVENVKSMIKET